MRAEPGDSEPCSTPGAIRLKDWDSSPLVKENLQYCDPKLLKWGWICANNWGVEEATVACRELGYGSIRLDHGKD